MSETIDDEGPFWSDIEQIVPLGKLDFDPILPPADQPEEKPPHVDYEDSGGLTED